ncbi:MAG: hypothetical protein Q7S06_03425 [Nanoarchaeota archaeon]|nr:hypothetical protein [Nanoarchaeota archaeon]
MKEWLNQPLKMKSRDSRAKYFGRLEEITPVLGFTDFFLGRFFPQVQERYAEMRTRYQFISEEINSRLYFVHHVNDEEIRAILHNSGFFRAEITRDYGFE